MKSILITKLALCWFISLTAYAGQSSEILSYPEEISKSEVSSVEAKMSAVNKKFESLVEGKKMRFSDAMKEISKEKKVIFLEFKKNREQLYKLSRLVKSDSRSARVRTVVNIKTERKTVKWSLNTPNSAKWLLSPTKPYTLNYNYSTGKNKYLRGPSASVNKRIGVNFSFTLTESLLVEKDPRISVNSTARFVLSEKFIKDRAELDLSKMKGMLK